MPLSPHSLLSLLVCDNGVGVLPVRTLRDSLGKESHLSRILSVSHGADWGR